MLTSLPPLPNKPRRPRRLWWLVGAGGALAILLLILLTGGNDGQHPAPAVTPDTPHVPGPPWRHGPGAARFTIVVYADLECPFCQSYVPLLREWIDAQSDINLQWHHLPLAAHEPAAGAAARWVECVGEAHGHARFWDAVSWVYQHTRGSGQGLPPGVDYPEQDQTVRACQQSERPAAAVAAQTEQARREGVEGTPSLRLIDHASERAMTLTGPVQGDALLSALDLLASPFTAEEKPDAP